MEHKQRAGGFIRLAESRKSSIEMLDEMNKNIQRHTNAMCAHIIAMGYAAENYQRCLLEQSPAYTHQNFMELLEQWKLKSEE